MAIRTKWIVPIICILWIAASSAAIAATQIGTVTRIQGACTAQTEGAARTLSQNSPVYLDDVVASGPAARLEIGLADGTMLTLGAGAQLTLDEFVYVPGRKDNRVRLVLSGAFRFVSGAAASPGQGVASVQTPVAAIGIRGTDFWGGPIDDAYGVLLLEGAVEVANPAGTVTLDEGGEGTNIAGPAQAPGAVTTWPQDKVDRAFATIAFQ